MYSCVERIYQLTHSFIDIRFRVRVTLNKEDEGDESFHKVDDHWDDFGSESELEDSSKLVSPHPLSQLSSNDNDANEFADKINIDFNDASNVATFIRQTGNVMRNDEVMKLIDSIGMNVPTYERDKKKSIVRFFHTIATHPKLKHLAERVVDPELDDLENVQETDKLERLVLLCRGVKTSSKYIILNSCLLIFSQDLVKKDHKHVDLMTRYGIFVFILYFYL